MSRLIVCDTGPLIHLREAGAIHLLEVAGDIPVPIAVQPGDVFSKYVLQNSKLEETHHDGNC